MRTTKQKTRPIRTNIYGQPRLQSFTVPLLFYSHQCQPEQLSLPSYFTILNSLKTGIQQLTQLINTHYIILQYVGIVTGPFNNIDGSYGCRPVIAILLAGRETSIHVEVYEERQNGTNWTIGCLSHARSVDKVGY